MCQRLGISFDHSSATWRMLLSCSLLLELFHRSIVSFSWCLFSHRISRAFRAEMNPDINESESKPSNWNDYRVPANTTGHPIVSWNLIDCWLLLKQKHAIWEIIISLVGIKQWQLLYSKRDQWHNPQSARNLNRFSWDWACCKAKMVDYRIRIVATG